MLLQQPHSHLMLAPSIGGIHRYPIVGRGRESFQGRSRLLPAIQMLPGMTLSPDKRICTLRRIYMQREGNDAGFGVGEWIPYLTVHYKFEA